MQYTYIWDENKRRENFRKHGFDFARAKEVFYDPNGFVIFDDCYDEYRYQFIGVIDGAIVTVVIYTEDDYNGVRRVISFRGATKTERKTYYGRRHVYRRRT